ncbi:MAG: autotransporter-associated beta strand repeat-containing protein [Verrucomicrobia bacterium]|nr:autotransporter-associated beta strand repeat-containing protein [Verrucomicrobiota bacterium]
MKSNRSNRFLGVLRRFFTASAIVISVFGTSHAQNAWTGAENSNWNTTSANWTSPTVWANGAAATIPSGSGNITVTENITASALTISGASDTITIGAGNTLSIERATVSPQNITTGGWTTQLRGSGTLRIDASAVWNGNNWGPDSSAAAVYNAGFTGTLHVARGRADVSPAGFGGVTAVKIGSGAQFLGWTGTYPQTWELSGAGAGEGGQPGAVRAAASANMNLTGGVTLVGNTEILTQDANSVITFNQPITGTGNLTLHTKGKFNFLGDASTSFNGDWTINTTAGAAASATITFNKTGGAVAVPAGKTVQFGTGGTGQANLRMSASNQFGAGVRLNYGNANGQWARLDLMGTSQTLAGIHTGSSSTTPNGGIVQNREISNTTANRGLSVLTLNGNTSDANYPVGGYLFNGYLRDGDSPTDSPTNLLRLVKEGTGTQAFAGPQFHLEGGVVVSGGILDFVTGNCMDNANGGWTVNAGGTLRAVAAQNVYGGLNMNGGTLAGSGLGSAAWGHVVLGGTLTVGGSQTSVISADMRVAGGNDRTFVINPTGDPSGIDLEITGKIGHNNGSTWGYMTKSGSGTMRFNGSTYSGTTTNNASDIGRITVNGGKIIFNEYIADMGNGGLVLNSGTVEVNANSNAVSFSPAISGIGSLVKLGSNSLTLSGASSYNGPVSIAAGTLQISGAGVLGSGNYVGSIVNSGTLHVNSTANQILGGGLTGTGGLVKSNTGAVVASGVDIDGTVTHNAGSLFLSGTETGAITVADSATFGGTVSAPAITLGTGISLLVDPSDALTSSGDLAVGGTVTVTPVGGFTPGTPFTVVGYANKVGTWDQTNFQLANASGYRGHTFNDTGSAVTLTISGLALEWNNAAADGLWDLDTTANFTDGASNQKFILGDAVTFGDIPAGPSAITLAGTLQPASVLVNSQYEYTFGGTGTIAGPTGLTKNGTGLLYVDTANTYTGATTLSGGRIAVGINNALGAGPIIPGAGSLSSDGVTARSLANPLALTGNVNLGDATENGVLTITGPVTLGAGASVTTASDAVLSGSVPATANGLTKLGSARLTLSGSNLFTGPLTINAGIVQLNSTAASGGAGTIAINGATLAVGPNVTTSADRAIAISGGATIDTTPSNTSQTGVISGLISGTGGLTIAANGDMSDTGGGVGGASGLANTGNDFTGDVTITAGLVRAQSGFGNASNKIILNGGGIIDQNLNIAFTRDIEVGPSGGTYRTYGSVGGSAGLYGAITGSGILRRTDGGTIHLAANGSGFTGTFFNARGTFYVDTQDWADADIVQTDGTNVMRIETAGTTTIKSLTSDRDVVIAAGSRLNIASGTYLAVAGTDVNGFWVQGTTAGNAAFTGAITSSSGTLSITNGAASGSLTSTDHQIRVRVEDFDGSTPLKLVKNNLNHLILDQPNLHTGGTEINGGRINANIYTCFSTGGVTVNDGGQAYLNSATAPFANNFSIAGVGCLEAAGNLGAIRFESNNRVSGSVTVQPAGARIVAYNGATGTVTGSLLGTGNLEINAVSANPFNGTINLNGSAASYGGTLVVSQGRCNMASDSAGGLTVRGTGNFWGEGTFAGDITLEANSTLLINPSTSGAITTQGELIAPTAPVNVSLNGPMPLGGGDVVVAQFDTHNLDEFDLPFALTTPANYRPGSGTFTLNANDVSVSVVVDQITWNNAGGNATWNLNTTANFRLSDDSANTNFFIGDHVVLGNLVAGGTITVSGTVMPSSLTFDSTSNYTLQTGSIGGGATILKKSTGILTLSAANTHTGSTTISQGDLRIGNVNSVGSSAVTLNDENTGSANTSFVAAAALNGINGNVVVTNNGTGTVTLGSNAGQAGLVVYNGTFSLGKAVTINGSSDRTTLLGKISGSPGTIRIGGSANHRVTIANAANDFVGDLALSTGVIYQSDSATALPATTSISSEGNAQYRLNNGGTHVINALSGSGSTYIVAGGVTTLSLGNSNGSGTYTGTVYNSNAVLSIIKNGTGTQALIGDNTYTGTNTVNGGMLVLSPRASQAGATTVADGAGLGIGGAAGSSWNAASLAIGSTGATTLNIGNFAAGGSPSVNVGTLTTGGTVTVNVSGAMETGSYPIIDYTGVIGGAGYAAFQLGTLPRGVVATLSHDETNTRVMLNVTAVNPVLWTGNIDGVWDIGTTENWSFDGNDSTFIQGDVVRFDDTAFETNVSIAAPVSPGSVTFDASVPYTLSGAAITGGARLTKSGTGTLLVTNANTYSGGTVINGGTIELGDGTIQPTLTGNYTIGTGGTLKVRYNTASGAQAQTWSRYTGGGTLVLATGKTFDTAWGQAALPATFTGTLQIEGGRVQNNSAGTAFGSAQLIRVRPGGHLALYNTPSGGTFTANLDLEGTGYGEAGYEGSVRLPDSNATIAGTIALAGATTISGSWSGTAVSTITAPISGPSTAHLTFNANSATFTYALAGANTYSGNTIVDRGVVRLAAADRIPDGADKGDVTVNATGVLNLNGFSETINGLAGVGPVQAGTGTPVLTVGAGDRTSAYTGVMSNGAGTLALTKTGTGTLTLGGANTYTGATTVNAGTLLVNGSLAAGSAVSVASGATLGGTGTVAGAVSVATGGTVSPGASVGTLATGAATLAGTYLCEIDGASADRVNVTGNLNLAGSTITFSVLNAPTQPEYIIATYTGTLSGAPASVTGLPAGYQIDTATSGQVKLVQVAGYDSWATASGLDGTNNGRGMDPDGDGVANLLEYYLGGDPLDNDGTILPQPQVTATHLVFTFNRSDAAAAEAATQEFQYGSTLVGWTGRSIAPATYPDGTVIEVVDNGETDAITVRIPRGLEVAGKIFGRLHIVIPE